MFTHNDPANLVKMARHQMKMTQEEFATLVGKTQPLISKYEIGVVTPPSDVILKCIQIEDELTKKNNVSVSDLMSWIETKLSGDMNLKKRIMLSEIIESIT